MVWETRERPPRLYVEQRGLNGGCIEIAPLFFRVSPTKGLFPIQDTRSLDNTHRDLKATQWGRDCSTKPASCPSLCILLYAPDFNSLCRMHVHIQRQTHSHANPHKIPSHTRCVSASVVWQWESWHHRVALPLPPSVGRGLMNAGRFAPSPLLFSFCSIARTTKHMVVVRRCICTRDWHELAETQSRSESLQKCSAVRICWIRKVTIWRCCRGTQPP